MKKTFYQVCFTEKFDEKTVWTYPTLKLAQKDFKLKDLDYKRAELQKVIILGFKTSKISKDNRLLKQ